MPRLRGAAPTPPPPPDPCVGVQQQTARTDGAGCLLYAHRPPRCVYHDDKQVAGPCNFDVASLSCTYAEAATITLAAAAPPVAPGTVASATAAPPEACGMRAAVAQAVAALRPLQVCGRSALPPPQQPARQQQRQQEQQQQQQQQQMPRVHPSGAGSWLPPSAAAASPGWRPSVAFRAPPPSITCPPEVIGAAGLVGWAQATGIRRIVMSGDSTMRQASVGRLWSKPALRIRGCSWHMCLHIVVWPPACRCPPARPPTYYPPACWPAGRPAFLLALLARSTAAVLRALPAPPRPLPACPPAHPPALSLPCSFSSAWSQFFQRVVTLSRAEPATVDVVSQRYAHYSLGWAAPAPANGSQALVDSLWFSADTYPAELRSNEGEISNRLGAAHAQLVGRSSPAAELPQGMASRELVVDLVMGTYRWAGIGGGGAWLGLAWLALT